MKNYLLFNQSFGTEGSPNQTGETLTRENRIGLMSYLRRTLMLLFAVLMMSVANVGMAWGADINDYATSFETTTDSWSKDGGTAGVLTRFARTGTGGAWHASNTTSAGDKRVKLAIGNTSGAKNTTYQHVIGYVRKGVGTSNTLTTKVEVYIGSSLGMSDALTLSTSWQRMSYSKNKTSAWSSAATQIRFTTNFSTSKADTVYFDDLIWYSNTSATIDLTRPSRATSASATTSSISWTNGSDTGEGATGIQATLIFHRTGGSVGGNDLTLNDQGIYSLTATEGPSVVGNWTLLSASVGAAATSYSGTFEAGHEYAIVHRDLAYNYSTPTYVTVAASGGGGATTYDVNIEDLSNGSITASPTSQEEGEDVTLTVSPSTGYELSGGISVTGDESGDNITATDNGDGTWTFEMPGENVTVDASFSLIDYSVSKTLTNCAVKDGSTAIPSTMNYGDDLSTTIEPTSGNLLPSSITVSGVTSYTWNALTGALTLTDVTGAVSISISAAAPQTGSGATVTYTMVTSGETAATYSTGVFTGILSGGTANKNTLVASNTLSGGNGVAVQSDKKTPKGSRTAGITSSTGDFSAGSSPYAEFTFDVVDGYTFTPTAISVPVLAITNNAYFTAIVTDGSSTWTSATSECTQGAQATINATPSGGSALTGTVNIRVFCHNQATAAKGFRIGTGSVTITGTVAEEASCTAPTAVYVTQTEGSADMIAGESFTLSAATSTGVEEGATYQWYRNTTEVGTNSPTYTVPSCTKVDAGTYWCKITNPCGKSTTNSTGFGIKVWQVLLLESSTWNSYDLTSTGTKTGELVHQLTPGTYYIKLTHNNGVDFGVNTGETISEITATTPSPWTLYNGQNNIKLTVTTAGEYTFDVNYTSADYPTLSVTYPPSTISSCDKIYFCPTVNSIATGSARFSIYFFNATESGWANCYLVSGTDFADDAKYVAYAPATTNGWTKMIVVRDDEYASSFDGIWNQSQDIIYNGYNYIVGTGYSDSKITTNLNSFYSSTTPAMDESEYCVIVGGTTTASTNLPSSAVTYISSDEAKATVGSTTGVITGVAAGTATITAKVGTCTVGTATVTVYAAPSVALSSSSVTYGASAPTLTPSNFATITGYSSSTTGTATINGSGVISIAGAGTTTFTVTGTDLCGNAANATTSTFTVNKATPTKYDFSVNKTVLCGEETATLTLAGSQSGVTYELREDSSTPIADTEKSGTGSALTWTGLGAGNYVVYAVETANYEERQMNSSKITISNGTATSITTQPTTPVAATVGSACSITGLVAAGTSPTYQWYTCNSDGSGATAITSTGAMSFTGYTSATLGLTPTAAGVTYYKCVVSGSCGDPVTSNVVTVNATAAASLTAISADVQYNAANMANIEFTNSDQHFTGLSTNHLFKVYGTLNSTDAFGKNETIGNITDDISEKSFTSAVYITAADNKTETADPTQGAIEIITPSTPGILYLYLNSSSSGLTLKKKGTSTSTSLSGAKYKAMAVDANTHYFINGSGSNRGLYAIKYVSTYSVSITTTNVTKVTGATGAGKAIQGKAYTATFTANTGYTLPSDATVTIGGESATKGTDYTWTISAGTATLTILAANVTGAINISVVGETPSGHTVTYNYNGATSGASPTSATGASVTLPNPTRTGYELDGWYTTAGAKVNDGGKTYNPTADITLYARWQVACDGSGTDSSIDDVAATGYTTYQEKGGSNVVFTSAPSIGFKYKDADGNTINNSTTAVVRNNAYKCQISSDSGNKGSIKINSTFSNVDSISFYFAASDKGGCKIAVWCSTDDFSADSTQLLSATTYADNNSEFKLKTLAIPSGQKASALRFKFRFTVTSSGKTSYIDSLKIYSSTASSGTCYHVYYHGNGAESGFVSDTTSYADGAKATVLSYNDSRYPLTKGGYDFQGWATSAGGSAAYSDGQKITIDGADVHLYAKWATASTALVTWKMKTADNEAWATTTGTGTTDGTNISSIGTSHDEGDDKAKNSATAKTAMASGEVSSTAAPDKSARFTFTIGATKQVEISKFDCKVFNVNSGNRTYKAQISDAAGNVYNSTNTVAVSTEATLTDASFVFGSGKILRGAVTIRIYAWKTSGTPTEFRMGPDVKFYGAVQDYACATPSAPTISGVSEYVPGQTITLTATHEGENYDNLTTYTWYKGDTWGGKSQVQAAATGSAGYTFTKASCAAGDAGKYWCEVANGTCNAHNSEGYNIIVYPTYTITYNLDGGTNPVDPAPKTSYTQFDEDYTLPIPTKDGFVFAGWYEASDFSGLPISTLESGSVGDREYWAKWGSAVTATWTITKVDDALYRGGGGYSVTAVINQADWDDYGDKDDLVLTATEGVTLKNVVKSINGEGKAQVFANFDITTGLEADATEITFTLDVPANGTYAPAELSHDEDLTDCGGGASGYTEFFSMIPKANTCSITNTEANSAPNHFTTCECTSSATITAGGSVTYGLYSSGTGTTSKYWEYNGKNGGWKHSIANSWVVLYSTDQFKAGDSIVITNGNSSSSGYYTIVASASNNTADYHSVSQVAAPSTTSPAKNTNYYYKLPASFVSSNYLVIRSSTSSACYVGTIKAYHAGAKGGVTPTLSWTPALASDGDWDSENNRLNKETGDVDFTFVAGQDKNSLGAITYSSNNPSVATVNAAGTVHIVGAAGDATITATLAASGCFGEATATYNIQVVDNCIDEPGTISTTDLGCSGIEMTVSGHTTSGETVSYQWYKVGTPDETVGTNSTTFTTTEAGEYYVVVTNTGTDHCSMASTNTVKVASKAAATATKIVDSWYVKNGRRTPDVALVQTAGATGFIVKSGETIIWESAGSTKTGFGGCGFHMGTDGIIYLNGTKDDGDATTGLTAGDVTLKITANDGCGSSASELSITIHCQEATTYKEIAFVVDGDKGKDFDQVTSGHADGTELYEYLDSVGTAAGKRLFCLTEQNIYSTTDEKAIRQHYSQYDAILITDDPSTNKVPNKEDYKTGGYVNAFGTMIDVRPILTMEAYVSALKNWGSKGIKGNPQSPNPRQYEMRLECKDHEIYGTGLPDPEDGTNVWEEVIDGETFRHVIVVDSTLGIYNGVAYNVETAGDKKPALQGFTGEAAGSLLGLGRILEGTLQAAIERQEEPAARLLVFGINAKALHETCALTDEGKTVIKNILVYLLKTNMEEVDDCSNYFTGKINNDWSNAGNWSKSALPSTEAKVRILAPCVVSGSHPHVAQVAIVSSGKSSIRETATGSPDCNGSLTINANGALIVEGEVLAAEAPHFAANNLKPTTVNDLIINTDEYNQAALIFDNEEAKTKATVNLYSLGKKPSNYEYQYFAVPMEVVPVNPVFANETHGGTGIYTYVYSEASSGWTRRKYYDDLFAFEGLGITTKSATAMEYEMTGNLASTATKEITLTHDGAGLNLIGNSWMAPIQIGALAEDNTDANITKTVYIYCAGRDAVKGAATSGDTETAGQWLAVPFEAAEFETWKEAGKLSVIPAMQAFQIKVDAEATLTLDYDKVVRGSTNDLNAKLRAPGRRMAANEVTMTNIRVADSKTHTDLSLFEGDRFSEAFDNGWEAEYMNGDGRSAKLYAETEAGQMAVAAMYDYEGTVVGFAPGQETEYTFSFMGEDNGYYLNDIKLQNSVRISEGETYTFTYEEGDAANRFYISRTAINAPEVATGMENLDAAAPKVQKIIYNDKLYIIRGGRLYDATGKVVK